MKTQIRQENPIAHAAFVDALSGEFLARTGCGVYVYLDPADVHRMFTEFRRRSQPIRDYARQVVRSYL